MSTFFPYQLQCECGHRHVVELIQGIHITRLPHARQELLDGTFQVFTCPSCRRPTVVEAPLVYTDFDRGHYVAMEPGGHLDWKAAEAKHRRVFEDSFDSGPPMAVEMGSSFRRRVVFGFRALREKLVLWDAGLDDRVVEALKGDLTGRLGAEPGDLMFRTKVVLPGGHLLLAAYDPDVLERAEPGEPQHVRYAAPSDFETIPAAEYRSRARRVGAIAEDYPWLHDDWCVDLCDTHQPMRARGFPSVYGATVT